MVIQQRELSDAVQSEGVCKALRGLVLHVVVMVGMMAVSFGQHWLDELTCLQQDPILE